MIVLLVPLLWYIMGDARLRSPLQRVPLKFVVWTSQPSVPVHHLQTRQSDSKFTTRHVSLLLSFLGR